jgi:hypothetical protein
MTGQLRTTLHTRADDLESWDVDLDTIVRDGHRRLRRRRVAVAGGLAGVLVVAGGIAAVAGRGHRTSPPPAGQDVKPLTYAVGSVIHTGSGTINVDERVVTLVQTHWGFVFSTPDHQLHQVRGGEVEPITTFDGHPSHLADRSPRLVASDDGWVTAWWDGERIQSWPGYRSSDSGQVDALDKTNSFNAARSWPSQDPPRIEAVSDGHLWFWDGQDHWIGEVRPMPTTAGWKDTNPPGSGTVVDAAGDEVLVDTGDGMAVTTANLLPWPVEEQNGWKPGRDLGGLRTQVPDVTSGDLAPDGRHWFTHDGGQFAVYDSTTGDSQDPTYEGVVGVTPYQWLGNDTIAATGSRSSAPGGPVSLLTCRVSTNDCTVAVADVGNAADVVVPDGLPAGSD